MTTPPPTPVFLTPHKQVFEILAKICLVFVSFKSREKSKASATTADELNLDVLEGRKTVNNNGLNMFFGQLYNCYGESLCEAAPLRSNLHRLALKSMAPFTWTPLISEF